jgi:hypothetical protein
MINVGYVPYSKALNHPADRRRLASWASASKETLNIDSPLDSDILFLSNAANFGYWLKRAKQPVVLDLVDAYMGEKPSFIKDLLRNIVRTFRGTSNLKWITYTNHLKQACYRCAAVVVASPEQRELILPFNKNVYVILDDHSELDRQIRLTTDTYKNDQAEDQNVHQPFIFWEGFGYTLKHFRFIASTLDDFLSTNNWGLKLITVLEFPRWGGYIGKVKTEKLIKQILPKSANLITVVPWTIENMVEHAKNARFAIIPLNPNDKFAALKSENKLMSMWHLGLLTLFSTTPAYSRVSEKAQIIFGATKPSEWKINLDSLLNSSEEHEITIKNSQKYIKIMHTSEILKTKWDLCIADILDKKIV